MERSLSTRARLRASTYTSPSCGSSFTSTDSRASCQGSARNDCSSAVRRPFGVPTRQPTGASPSRIAASVSSVGMPRSMIHTRSERP